LIVLLGLWIANMLVAWAVPARLWKSHLLPLIVFDVIAPILFVAIIVLGVITLVSYVRWTRTLRS
jgi:hypothetical protein